MKKKDELINKIFFKKYKILKKIGKGSFGLVYLGQIINSNKFVAVKFEPKNQKDLILERESYLLYFLRGFGIPEVITYGHNSKYNILIQTLLGNSINTIFIQNNKKFSMKDCCMIGIQILDRLEYIHSKNIIHRDIKPDNFLEGNPDNSIIYLIDFGLSKKYMSSRTGKHVKFSINKKWSGTSRFASANSLRGVAQSRRDDLESLCYVLLFLMKGSLPWDNVFGYTENDDILLIYKIKKYMKPDLLFLNLPLETVDFFKYCKKLDFEQKPDYSYLRSLLLQILNKQNEKNDLKFSWIIKNNNNLTNQNEANNRYKKNTKRKNSPQQRLFNSLINNKVKLAKRSESLNEMYLKEEINKVTKDCQPIKNISPSPTKNLYKNEQMEEGNSKYKYIKKIPNGKKRIINIEINNLKKKYYNQKNNKIYNIISKTETDIQKMKNKKINIIPLENNGKKLFIKKDNVHDENEKEKVKKILFKNNSLIYNNNNINSIRNIKDVYNKFFIKKKNSFNLKEYQRLYPFKISNFNEYQKINNSLVNSDKKDDKLSYNSCLKNSFDNLSYNLKRKNQKKNIFHNLIFDELKNDINIKNMTNDAVDKMSNQNSSLNFNNIYNNKIVFPQNLKYSHLSPDQLNKYKIKLKNDKISFDSFNLNKKNVNANKNNQFQLNFENHNTLNNFNNLNNNKNFNKKFLTTEQINCKPPKNIKIINIISPISKVSSYTKVKKNSFCAKSNLYKNNGALNNKSINNFNNNNNNIIINNYCDNKKNKNHLFSKYYTNASFIGTNYDQISKNNNSLFSFDNSINQYSNRIFKTNSCFLNNLRANRNFMNINLRKDIIEGSFNYITPKSIEKFKTNC